MGYATGPGLDPVPLANNTILDESTLSGTYYSSPVDMQNRTFVKLGVDFTKGSLTNCVFTIQIWNGLAWVDDYAADGTTAWTLTLTADKDYSVLVGDQAGEIESPTPFAWRFFRVKAVPTGTASGSSVTLRAAAK
jgi:hypothetical protein